MTAPSPKTSIKRCKDITKLKEIFLKYFLNISLDDYIKLIDNVITKDTIDRILKEPLDEEQRNTVELLAIIINFLSETINSTNEIESLKALLNGIKTQEERSKINAIFSIDIIELIQG